MKMVFFIFAVLGIIVGGNAYVFFRLWQLLPPLPVWRTMLIIAAVILVSSPILGIAGAKFLPPSMAVFWGRLGTSWLIAFLYLLMTFLVCDLLRTTKLIPAIDACLRANWITFGLLVVGMATLLVAGYVRYRNKDSVEITLPLNRPFTGGNLKIVAVSDMHLGYTIGREELEQWVTLINAEDPDLILIAGDITDNNVRPLIDGGMAEAFHRLRSRYGVYAVPGNHEYIAGIAPAADFLRSADVTLLRDTAILIDSRFYLVGRDDYSNPRRKSLADLTASLDVDKPLLLLDHQPHHLEEAAFCGIALQFSGHTHDGQVWPLNYITRLLFECSHGYLKKGDTHI
ncbi:MAG: metallophosphoesterase, partial [Tannerellaceae bacterium]|nr:metallophosphoesterase [Tannerellaceae bacterium]